MKEAHMAYNEQDLRKLLGLESTVVETITFGEFLKRLKDSPEIADTAAATLVRAIESKGEVDIKTAPEALRPHLSMLKKMGVTSWKAFKKVRGSQRTVARIMKDLRAAAANGYQLRLAYLLKGGPGSGKSYLADAFKDCLEGEIVYAIEGCPVHENPLNLFNLIPSDRSEGVIDAIAEMLELTHEHRLKQAKGSKPKPSLRDLLATAGDPCQVCWSGLMEGLKEGEEPNILNMKVQALRLSSRKFGIATWSKDCSLATALRKGSRGVVDMPEIFGSSAANGNATGSADELDLLLEATNDRRIPAGCSSSDDSGGHVHGAGCSHGAHEGSKVKVSRSGMEPLDCVMIGQTNDGAYDRFIKEQADPNKFTRRLQIINVPYITSVSEEEAAYHEFIENMRDKPHFDPMTLKIAALLAVISRMKKDHAEVDIVSRARMYDGEQLVVEMKNPTALQQQQSSGGFGGGALSTGGNSGKSDEKREVRYWSVGQFWAEAGEDEGMYGLNMPSMLKLMSEAVELSLRAPTSLDDPGRCVSTFEMLQFLRSRIAQLQKTPGLTKKEEEVLKNCLEYLKGPSSITGPAGLIEEEYRRVLRRQFLAVMAPDFDRRATEIFERYRVHARAVSSGDKKCKETVEHAGKKVERLVDVDIAFLNDIETWMKITSQSDKDVFRRSVETQITPYLLAQVELNERQKVGDDSDDEKVELTWRSLPKLAGGISAKLNDETSKKLGRLLKSEIDLNDEDKELRRAALDRFSKLGYCEHCRQVALTYFNDYQLWKLS
jgi:predicted Ser/Thr protein kinase